MASLPLIERVPKTLHKTDGSTTGLPVGCGNAGAAADRGEDGAHKNLQNISHQGRIICQAVAKAVQDPGFASRTGISKAQKQHFSKAFK